MSCTSKFLIVLHHLIYPLAVRYCNTVIIIKGNFGERGNGKNDSFLPALNSRFLEKRDRSLSNNKRGIFDYKAEKHSGETACYYLLQEVWGSNRKLAILLYEDG
jgi:hypothetical protein